MIIFITVVVSVVIGLFVERILFKKFKEGKSNKEFKTSEYLLGGLVIQTVIIVLSCVIGLYINDMAVERRELDDAVTKTQNMVEICNREIRNNNNYMSKYTSGEKSIEYFKLNAHLNLDYYDIVLLDTSVQKYMDAEAFYNAYVYHSRIKLNLENA
ncbi:MAG: hypothetical protein MJ171_05405 [Clostridia bacterium]|nr:hypothetical protein [Clostridia bacterium]